ncbi:unnamed protein product [Pleuronectes platessa]|uniref:Uncharacterized protein n=1 Tax=Pleuronectes platessa TaxID=8262 RepID=A0A9N7UJS2_PLEPL|nr:unnamed protein product [Pleuronectes platessa]
MAVQLQNNLYQGVGPAHFGPQAKHTLVKSPVSHRHAQERQQQQQEQQQYHRHRCSAFPPWLSGAHGRETAEERGEGRGKREDAERGRAEPPRRSGAQHGLRAELTTDALPPPPPLPPSSSSSSSTHRSSSSSPPPPTPPPPPHPPPSPDSPRFPRQAKRGGAPRKRGSAHQSPSSMETALKPEH